MMNTVEVRSPACVVSVTPTVATVIYTAGDCVGDVHLIGNAARTPGAANPVTSNTTSQGTVVLQSITVVEYSSGGTVNAAPLDFFFFSSQPSGSEIIDSSPPDIDPSDLAKFVGKVSVVADDYELCSDKVGVASVVASIVMPAGIDVIDLWAVAVTSTTPTFDSTSALTFKYGFLQN